MPIVLIKRVKMYTETNTEGKRSSQDQGRERSDAARPKIPANHQKLGKSPQKEGALPTLGSCLASRIVRK